LRVGDDAVHVAERLRFQLVRRHGLHHRPRHRQPHELGVERSRERELAVCFAQRGRASDAADVHAAEQRA